MLSSTFFYEYEVRVRADNHSFWPCLPPTQKSVTILKREADCTCVNSSQREAFKIVRINKTCLPVLLWKSRLFNPILYIRASGYLENQQPHPIIHSAGKPEDFTSLAYGARVTSIVAHLGSVWIEWTVHVPLMIIIGYAVSLHIFKALYTKIDCPSPLSLPPVPEKYLEQQQQRIV